MRILSRTGVPVTVPLTIVAAALVAAGCGGLRVGPRGIVQAYPAISDDQIRAAIGLPAAEQKSIAVHRGLWGNFDGDEYRDLAVLVEAIDKTDRAGDSAARLYILEATDTELGATAEVRCGYWRGERVVAKRERHVGPTLQAIDVDGDGVDEILCRYDECGVATGASYVHARIYGCTGDRLRTVWDELVDVRDSGWRCESPLRYVSALTFSRGEDGAMRVFVSSSREQQNRDSRPARIECRHKILKWNGHGFVAEKNELVYAKDIRPDVKLSMEDVP